MVEKNEISNNPYQPKVFGMKFGLREIERSFHIKIRNFKL